MRALLFSAGFLPVGPAGDGGMGYLRSSLDVAPALFAAVSDDTVAMTDLGRRGRFGNQLFASRRSGASSV